MFSCAYIIFLATAVVRVAGLSAKELYRFPNETFIENLASSQDGSLLLTTFGEGRVYIFDPLATDPEPHLVVEVPGLNALTGLAEVGPGTYAVSGAVREGGFNIVNGSCEVATFDVNTGVVAPVARVPSAGLLNGMVALPYKQHVIFSVDSIRGQILRIDTSSGKTDVSFEHEMLAPVVGSGPVPLGVNGIKLHKHYLYFTNSNRQLFARVKINRNGDVIGDIEEVFQLEDTMRVFDDFDISSTGDSYIALELDSLVKVTKDGNMVTLVSPGDGRTELLRPTATLLSRDEKTLYVVTAGLEDDERGQIVQVDL